MKLQGELLTKADGENPAVIAGIKKWTEIDRIVKREQERLLAVNAIPKRKFTFEYKPEDWLDMVTSLPELLEEMDIDLAAQKSKNA